MENVERGTVVQWNGDRGMIQIAGSGQEVSVFKSGLIDSIRTGDQVSFGITESPAGPTAVAVRLA